MVSLLDNTGVQHYANKMVLAENRKVGSKSLPTALNDIDNLIDEMKTQFDAEYGSALDMKLENNKNLFSVGTGTNVDKKSEIENSFTDVELSGNSLVNLVSTKGSNLFVSSGSGVAFNTTFNADLTRCVYTTKKDTNRYITIRTGSKERIKSNTTYTLIFNILKNNISELQRGISIRGASDPYYTQNVSDYSFNIHTDSSFNITSGIKVISFTTGGNVDKYTGFGFGFPCITTNVAEQQFEIGDIVLLEGDYVNRPILQYFKGLKSVGEKDDGNHKISISSMDIDLQAIEGSTVDSTDSYKEDKKEILLNEPLRGLSNGVKDTIEKINGEWKIVRRCEEIVLNGSENWGTSGMTPQENTLIFQGDVVSQLVKPNSSAKSDKFATYNGATTDEEGLLPFSGTSGTRIYLRIKKSKLSSQDVVGFKKWLSQNPTKVVYQLATPIIEDISPITLQCWKNGTISIDEDLPVETTHTVALNKPAQIKRNIEELTALRKRVQTLEEQYDQIALEQAHQLNLINHSIELDYNI